MAKECKREECYPLKSVSELWEWNASCSYSVSDLETAPDYRIVGDHIYDRKSLTLLPRISSELTPKTLFCHDMKGGYLEDRWVEGGEDPYAYRFWYWSLIDVFCYFSHNLITIPPPGWISCAHTHSVPVIGTFITEWDDGAKSCDEIFASKESVLRTVNQMVAIAKHFSFEGWLINIENKVPKDNIHLVILFLEELTKGMRKVSLQSHVIWYDSVTIEGELKWQNELNSLNNCFFDACDGFFLNYTWKSENLQATAIAAKQRHRDIYVGADVFGRGCLGDGGFNTNEAVKVSRSFGLSVALFAPSWTHEHFAGKDFVDNEEKFWSLLFPYLFAHGPSNRLPFTTFFNQGVGLCTYNDSVIVKNSSWYNLCHQSYQQMFPGMVKPCFEDGYSGSGCLQILASQEESTYCQLFGCEFAISSTLTVKYYLKGQAGLIVAHGNPDNLKDLKWSILWSDMELLKGKFRSYFPIKKTDLDNSWKAREYELEVVGSLLAVGILVHSDDVFLGGLSLC